MHYTGDMDFDWDAANIAHIARHKVTPEEAEQAVTDPERLARPTYSKDNEPRLSVTGLTFEDRLLTVVVTMRPVNRVRVVTARPASSNERRLYEEATP